ncbi:MAG: rhomboid family intramembrane serine protease [Gemmatimonadota bacterium]|nr:rhomboid family intramembrane serine protease [Gemmatimonadota bacterium]MDP6802293.1 rhomboid family intramembrane serine protease [Gemmatimonadota bacterium]MDP7031973.1 rhomboid family intramembrane serine protease [Gemmatimonadota bacterium]
MYFFFFFPVGTEADGRDGHPPVGTACLVSVCLLIFAAGRVLPGLHASLVHASFRPDSPSLTAAVLSLFVHGNWFHVLGNALYLWVFGRQIESRIGVSALALLFVAGGVAGCWIQAAITPVGSPSWTAPVVGASGGVAAFLGAALVAFRHRRVRILYFLFALLHGVNRAGVARVGVVPAILVWAGLQLAHGLVAVGGATGGVAWGSHGGGFAAGLLMATVLGLSRLPRREVHRDRARRHLSRGEWYPAIGELTAHLSQSPEDATARGERAEAFLLAGRPTEAVLDYRLLLKRARQDRDPDAMVRILDRTRRHGLVGGLGEGVLLRLPFEFVRMDCPHEAVKAWDIYLEACPEGEAVPLAWLRRGDLLARFPRGQKAAEESWRVILEEHADTEWSEAARDRLRRSERGGNATPQTCIPNETALSGGRQETSARHPRAQIHRPGTRAAYRAGRVRAFLPSPPRRGQR